MLLALARDVFARKYGSCRIGPSERPTERQKELVAFLFSSSDDEVLHMLLDGASPNVSCIAEHLRQRTPYKAFATIQGFGTNRELYDQLTDVRWGREGSWERSDRFLKSLIARAKERGCVLRQDEVILDVPDPNKEKLGNLNMLTGKELRPVVMNDLSAVWGSIGTDFPRWARKIRVFMSPEKDEELGSKLNWEGRWKLVQEALKGV